MYEYLQFIVNAVDETNILNAYISQKQLFKPESDYLGSVLSI